MAEKKSAKGRKWLPPHMKPYTIQADIALYDLIKKVGIGMHEPAYMVVNSLLLMGAEVWNEKQKDRDFKIDLTSAKLKEIKDLVKKLF